MELMLILAVVFCLIGLPSLIYWVWALVDCLKRPDDTLNPSFGNVSPKLVWAAIIFFGSLLGAVIYVWVAGTGRNPRRRVVQVDPAATDEGKRVLQLVSEGKIKPDEAQRLMSALGTKKIETEGGSTPKAAKVGCSILILSFIAVPLLWLCFSMGTLRRAKQEQDRQRHDAMQRQIGTQVMDYQRAHPLPAAAPARQPGGPAVESTRP